MIAKVKIENTDINGIEITHTAKVITALKGVEKGQTLDVLVKTHSCQHDKGEVGKTYYIAGTISDKNLFEGEWKNQELQKDNNPEDVKNNGL